MKNADYSSFTDEELLEAHRAGDNTALDSLLGRYVGFVKQKAFRYFLIGADKDDLIQEGMIGLFKATRDFNNTKNVSFRSFAEICIRRQIATAIKASTRQKHIPLNTSVSLNKPVYDEESDCSLLDMLCGNFLPGPEEIMINQEHYHSIGEKINSSLSKFEHQVLSCYLQGRSYQEIGILLNKSTKAIDNALQRIKRKVEKVVSEVA
ncbi:MAG: RNA polymerase sporulation sigma factor SigH [Bacillota bacterium]|nr:RNA polymerase sporulation sigma factor SigH [Bacillota bacterium]